MNKLIKKYTPIIFKAIKPHLQKVALEIVIEGSIVLITVSGKKAIEIISKYKNKIGQVNINPNNNNIILYPMRDGKELYNLVSNDSILNEDDVVTVEFTEVQEFINKFNRDIEGNDENKITRFKGKYLFLSSMYICPIEYKGIKYNSSEVAFQSMKFDNEEMRREIAKLSAKAAHEIGRKYPLKKNWHNIKEDIMYDITLCKFKQNKDLAKMLINTGTKELIQENNWNDTVWGTVNGIGENKLGKILMKVREEIKLMEI